MAERRSKKIGVLWLRETNKGGTKMRYFSGILDLGVFGEIPIVVFKANKTKDSSPDFNILLSEQKESAPRQSDRHAGDEDDSDIPF